MSEAKAASAAVPEEGAVRRPGGTRVLQAQRSDAGFGGAERRQKGDGEAVRGKPFPRPLGVQGDCVLLPSTRKASRFGRLFWYWVGESNSYCKIENLEY